VTHSEAEALTISAQLGKRERFAKVSTREVKQMSSWVEVSKTGELVKGAMKEVLIKEQEILLVRVGDNYYASDDRCPHMGGKLSRGRLDGAVVTCPRHGSQFDVIDGNVVQWLKRTGFFATLGKMLKSPRPIRTYPVKLDDDRIMVQIPDKA